MYSFTLVIQVATFQSRGKRRDENGVQEPGDLGISSGDQATEQRKLAAATFS